MPRRPSKLVHTPGKARSKVPQHGSAPSGERAAGRLQCAPLAMVLKGAAHAARAPTAGGIGCTGALEGRGGSQARAEQTHVAWRAHCAAEECAVGEPRSEGGFAAHAMQHDSSQRRRGAQEGVQQGSERQPTAWRHRKSWAVYDHEAYISRSHPPPPVRVSVRRVNQPGPRRVAVCDR